MSNSEKENTEINTAKSFSKRAGKRKNHKDVFITRLRMLLDDPNITTVSWHPSGKAVMVDKRYIDTQVNTLFPECFGNDKFTSIRQNLGAHGFKSACKRQNMKDGIWKKYNHVLSSNRFLHIYEHALFRRDKPDNDKLIKRIPVQRRFRQADVNCEKYNIEDAKGVKTEDRNDEAVDDQEPETARLNIDERRPRRSGKLRWKFYSADDEDYKVSQQHDQESDESQTPIAEDQEQADTPAAEPSKTGDSKTVQIKPVHDLVSPVLESLEELEDPVLYSITEAKDPDEWKRGNKMKPEIQSSSIWKPMTSPLGDPNAQMSTALDDTDTDGVTKRCETPVDLTTREKINIPVQKKMVRKSTKPTVVSHKNVWQPMSQNNSDDDMPDEETFSTLAAFCQAKVSALYSGMVQDETADQNYPNPSKALAKGSDTKPVGNSTITPKEEKVSVVNNMKLATVTKVLNPVQLIQIVPPAPKRLKFAKPNKVKIDLSMPLCSAMQSTTISGRIAGNTPLLGNLPSATVPTPVTKELLTNPGEVTELNQCMTEETKCGYHTRKDTDQTTETEAKSSGLVCDTQESLLTPNSQLLFSPTFINMGHGFVQTIDNPGKDMMWESEEAKSPKINFVPVACTKKTQTSLEEVDPVHTSDFQSTDTCIPVTVLKPLLQTDVCGDTADQENGESNHLVLPDIQPTQKLPSIDEIFKPLSTTPLVATPTVAANVEVSSKSVLGRTPCNLVLSHTTSAPTCTENTSFLPLSRGTVAAQATGFQKNRSATAMNSGTSKPKSTCFNDGRKRYPVPKMTPYVYPYPPTNPGYLRWPAQYTWPPYMSMPGRYPPYYPCALPSNHNAYPH